MRNEALVQRPSAGGVSRPYEGYASLYDLIQGDSMLRLLQRNFDHVVARYGIRFHSAADVACGTGGFLRHLAGFGVRLFGVDRSRAMLREARRKNPSPVVRLLCQDMRALRLPCPVDLITCNFDSLNYLLTPEDLAATFRAFWRNLTRRGHLLCDMITNAWPEPAGERVTRFRTAQGQSTWRISWTPQTGIRQVVMINLLPGPHGEPREEREVHTERAYPTELVVRLMEGSGLQDRAVLDAVSLRPARPGTTRALYLATRG